MSTDYESNAYIDALPRPLSRPEWVAFLNSVPEPVGDERTLPHADRYLCALRVLRFFRAGARQARFARGFDATLREGYLGRVGGTRAHEARLDAVASAREAGGLLEPGAPVVVRNAMSSSLIGVPGMGKTATLDRVTSRYPQVVRHEDGETQLVWLKLQCPALGSIKQLCRDFFKGVDGLLGAKTYETLYSARHLTDDDLMDGMVAVANMHSLGCLMIDEIQHLGKAGDEEHVIMTFLTTLINKIGVPVIFVGTMSCFDSFSKTGRMGRRAIGPASAVWSAYPETDGQWRRFVEELWEYQWTAERTPPTPELLAALHDRSQGIVDVVTKLWFAIQVTAMDDSEGPAGDKLESITVDLINEVAYRHLKPMAELLAAIRSGDPDEIAKFDDMADRNEAFFQTLRDRDNDRLNEALKSDEDKASIRTGPAYVGQCASMIRENLEWRRFDMGKITEVMRRTSEIEGAPASANLIAYCATLERVVAEAEPVRTGRAARPTKAEIEATFKPGDQRREDDDGLAAVA